MAVKPKPPAKPKREEDEFLRVTKWRFQALIAIGLTPDQAVALIEKADVVHAAQKLSDAGCPPALITRLLQGD